MRILRPPAGVKRSILQICRSFISVDEVLENSRDFFLGKHKTDDVAEEYREAYKNIDEVMENQTELVTITRRLKTAAVLKG